MCTQKSHYIIVLVNQLAEIYVKHSPQNYNSCLLVVRYSNKTEENLKVKHCTKVFLPFRSKPGKWNRQKRY